MGMRKVGLEHVATVELSLEGKKTILPSADGADNAQKSFLPSELSKN